MEPLAFFEWRCHLLLGGCLSYEVKTKKIFRHNTKLTGYVAVQRICHLLLK